MAVLITGVSAGFGEAMCRAFVGALYRVIGAALPCGQASGLGGFIGHFVLPFGNGRVAPRVGGKRLKRYPR